MADELLLIASPAADTDPDILIEFCLKKVSLEDKSLSLIISADIGVVQLAEKFASILNAPSILVDYSWDSLHTPEGPNPQVALPNVEYCREPFGPETAEDFSARLEANLFLTSETTKIVLVDTSVMDAVSQTFSYLPDQVLLLLGPQPDGQGIVIHNAVTFSDYQTFQSEVLSQRATEEREIPVAENPPQTDFVQPTNPLDQFEAPAEEVVRETVARATGGLSPGDFVLPAGTLDTFKTTIVEVVRETVAGAAGGLSSDVLAILESRVVVEASKLTAKVTEAMNESMKRQSSEFTEIFSTLQSEHFKFHSEILRLFETVKSQQQESLKSVQEVTEAVTGKAGSLSKKDVDNLLKAVECYESTNAVVLQTIEKLRPKQPKKFPVEITDVREAEGTDSYVLVFANRKVYSIEDLDIELENDRSRARSILTRNVKANTGENTVQLAIPLDTQGKFYIYLSQRGKQICEKFDFDLKDQESEVKETAKPSPSIGRSSDAGSFSAPPPAPVVRTEFPPKGGPAGLPKYSVPSFQKSGMKFFPPKLGRAGQKEELKETPKPVSPAEAKPTSAPEPKPFTPQEPKPVAPEAKPVPPEAKPVAPEAKPVPPEAKPVPPEAKPVPPEAKPVPPEAKPVPRIEVKPVLQTAGKPEEIKAPGTFSNQKPGAEAKPPSEAKPSLSFGTKPFPKPGPFSGMKPSLGVGKMGFSPANPLSKSQFLPGETGKTETGSPLMSNTKSEQVAKPPEPSSELKPELKVKLQEVKELFADGWSPQLELKITNFLKTDKGSVQTPSDIFGRFFSS